MSIEVIKAVKCAKCNKLHPEASSAYLTVLGKIVRRRSSRSGTETQPQFLGTEETPTVLCDNDECLRRFIMLED